MGQSIEYTIEPSKEGSPTLAVVGEAGNRIYLHSAIRPSREAESLRSEFNPDKYDTLIVLGAGLGYHLAPLRDLAPSYRCVIVIDAIPGIEREIAGLPDLLFLTRSDRIRFLTGKNDVEMEAALPECLDLEQGRGIQVLEHPSSIRAFPGYYLRAKKLAERILNAKLSNMATMLRFSMRYYKNSLINIAQLHQMRPVSHLFNRFIGKTALIVSSGPSLEAHLHTLKENGQRAFIIAVDSALPVLSCSSIRPDILVSVDPQAIINEHLYGCAPDRTISVYALSSHPYAVGKDPGFLSLNTHPVAQLLDELAPGAIGSIDSRTGTVAGDAILCAIRMGFSRIGLVGIDSSFPGMKIYARGTAYQRRYALYFQTRFSPVETRNLSYIMKASKCLRHEGLYTRRSFLTYRERIEELIRREGAKYVFRLRGDGIPIEGSPSIDTGEFFSKGGVEKDKETIVRALLDDAKTIDSFVPQHKLRSVLLSDAVRFEIYRACFGRDFEKRLDRLEAMSKSLLTA